MLGGVVLDKTQPIGVFDSGLGGLTVATRVFSELPHENVVYLADTSRVPYGPLPKETVAGFVMEICEFLVGQNCKAIVIACNTATAAGLEAAQKAFDLPIIGVIKPGARMAVRTTRNATVGVLGTEGTIKSGAYPREIQALMPGAKVFGQACPKFTILVEGGRKNPEEINEAVRGYLKNLEGAGFDTLVLGCTHYPLLADYIQPVVGNGVTLVNPAVETVEDLKKILAAKNLFNDVSNPSRVFYTSSDIEVFRSVASVILGISARDASAMDIRHMDWKS